MRHSKDKSLVTYKLFWFALLGASYIALVVISNLSISYDRAPTLIFILFSILLASFLVLTLLIYVSILRYLRKEFYEPFESSQHWFYYLLIFFITFVLVIVLLLFGIYFMFFIFLLSSSAIH